MNDEENRDALMRSWKRLSFHFTDPLGLVVQIERTGEISEKYVKEIEDSLLFIKAYWEKNEFIPKEELTHLLQIHPTSRLSLSIPHYPHQAKQLLEIIKMIDKCVYSIFAPKIYEIQILSAIDVHLTNVLPTFVGELRSGSIQSELIKDLHDKIEALGYLWQGRQNISKEAALILSRAGGITGNAAGLYSQQEIIYLQKIEQDIVEHILKILE